MGRPPRNAPARTPRWGKAREILSDGERPALLLGTTAFALPAFDVARAQLAAWGVPVRAVTTPPATDRRGRPVPSAVAAWAGAVGVACATPQGAPDLVRLADLAPRLMVVAAYGRILPRPLLEACPDRVNIHPSLLPRWRGAAPVARAILAGDAETGVSLLDVVAEVDAGDLYAQRRTPIGPTETAGELTDRLATLAAAMLGETLQGWKRQGGLHPRLPQVGEATYAHRLTARDEVIDWHGSADAEGRRVRALAPLPGATTTTPRGRLKVLAAVPVVGPSGAPPGTVVAAGPAGIDVACGVGRLSLQSVQPAGGRTMAAAAYARGRPSLVGERWGRHDA
jgi:methionyl-tRNA formyltransferase